MEKLTIQNLPKVELHVHLDCCLSYEVVARLAPAVSEETYRKEFIAPAKCQNLADLLSRIDSSLELMQTEKALELVTFDLFEQFASENVIYAEVRFAPLLHLREGLTAERVVEVVEKAVNTASSTTGVDARLILCTLRHFDEEQSMQTARLVKAFKGSRVVALDLAANEAGFPLDAHIPAFRFAQEHGLSRIAHAGEARGAESVRETLEHLRPSRIGHGVRSIEDPALLDHLKNSGIHLEVCPSCNVQIDIFDTYADHPVNRLFEYGISVGINTDGRTLTGISLSDEYERLHRTFGWDEKTFLTCNLNALKASFLPDERKQALEQRLKTGPDGMSGK